VAGGAVQYSQYGILFKLESQGDMFEDTHTHTHTHKIVPRSARLPESNVDFMPSQTILKCEQTSTIADSHSVFSVELQERLLSSSNSSRKQHVYAAYMLFHTPDIPVYWNLHTGK
jgi:hypothetical protein